jgi:hypothetical protein
MHAGTGSVGIAQWLHACLRLGPTSDIAQDGLPHHWGQASLRKVLACGATQIGLGVITCLQQLLCSNPPALLLVACCILPKVLVQEVIDSHVLRAALLPGGHAALQARETAAELQRI